MLTLTTNSSPACDGFRAEYEGQTTANPLNGPERLWSDVALVELRTFDGRISVAMIRTVTRGKGDGSRVLRWLCELADKHQVEMRLTAKPVGNGLDAPTLRRWYGRHGFKAAGAHMIRRAMK